MSRSRQRTNPADAALARLADLAGRGVRPARMEREVEAIVAGWTGGANPADADEMAERLDALQEQLAAGASDAAEQLADVDRSDVGAVRHASMVHAALMGALDAVECTREAQRVAAAATSPPPAARPAAAKQEVASAAPAPVPARRDSGLPASPVPMADREEAPAVTPAPMDDAVTIDPLAGWNPQGVDHGHTEEVRVSGETSRAPASTEPAHTQAKARKTRRRARAEEKDLYAPA